MAHDVGNLYAKDPPWIWHDGGVRVHTTTSKAQTCPVCLGKTTMPASFYDPPTPGTSAPTITAPVQCKSCFGRGIVYVQESVG